MLTVCSRTYIIITSTNLASLTISAKCEAGFNNKNLRDPFPVKDCLLHTIRPSSQGFTKDSKNAIKGRSEFVLPFSSILSLSCMSVRHKKKRKM